MFTEIVVLLFTGMLYLLRKFPYLMKFLANTARGPECEDTRVLATERCITGKRGEDHRDVFISVRNTLKSLLKKPLSRASVRELCPWLRLANAVAVVEM